MFARLLAPSIMMGNALVSWSRPPDAMPSITSGLGSARSNQGVAVYPAGALPATMACSSGDTTSSVAVDGYVLSGLPVRRQRSLRIPGLLQRSPGRVASVRQRCSPPI